MNSLQFQLNLLICQTPSYVLSFPILWSASTQTCHPQTDDSTDTTHPYLSLSHYTYCRYATIYVYTEGERESPRCKNLLGSYLYLHMHMHVSMVHVCGMYAVHMSRLNHGPLMNSSVMIVVLRGPGLDRLSMYSRP